MSYVPKPRWSGQFLPPGAAGLYRSPVGMYHGHAVQFRRGMGDSVLNPAAGTSLESKCGFFQLGLFKPECWCATSPWLCGMSSAQEAAQAQAGLENPSIYASTVAPVAGVIPGGLSTSTAPAGTSLDSFNSAYYAALQAGQSAADATNSAIMSGVNDALVAAGESSPDSGISTWVWAALGAAVLLGVMTVGR